MRNRFEGWYYKHQANGKSLALIPGRSGDGAFVQVVTDDTAFYIPFPLSHYQELHLECRRQHIFASRHNS